MTEPQPAAEKRFKGIAVSPGIIIGKARVVDRSKVKIFYRYLVDDVHVAREQERFALALRATEEQLVRLKNGMPEHVKEHSFILDSYLMILKDNMLCDATARRIVEEKINAEWAIKKSLQEIRDIFSQIDDEYISNRIHDVENVTERVLRNLSGQPQESLSEVRERVIIVAHDLSPADTTELNVSKVMGFVTDLGGRTSHTAIMAQALEIPGVVGLAQATKEIRDGDLLIVDGNAGEVLVNPDDGLIIEYQEKQVQVAKYKSAIARTSHLPAETLDGHRVRIMANIEFLEEVTAVREYGGEGIGLYRTEFLYLKNPQLPDEEELFEDYRDVAELVAPDVLILRTLDLGGDKFMADLEITREMNPALGLRAIRFCLKEPEIFETQLRAILRAGAYGNVQVMFPMISGLQEVLEAKAILEKVKGELEAQGLPHDPDMKVGAMIEIPSAVTVADILAQHVDFFSIGTNDLIQYALAIDRINGDVSYLYEPFHPAILRMIRQVLEAAGAAGIDVSLCGEMAGDPLCVPVLLGLGLETLSMNARSIPLIKTIIRSLSMEDARKDAEEVGRLTTADEVRGYMVDRVRGLFPDMDEGGALPFWGVG
ncbi:MAG: phosphoenolpyruvate--protein phosphotransferase [Deltaproteobacteria bacterium]|nr:phosphoenolpyruvate--protein phosphotransferase [Deltaproteobacteria bacterium]